MWRSLGKLWDSSARVDERRLTEARFATLAWLAAPLCELALGAWGLQDTLRLIERLTPPPRGAEARVDATRAAELVALAYRWHVVRGQCLPRALLQYGLLRREGASVRFVIGVKPGAAKTGALEAHAWVEDEAAPAESAFAPLWIAAGEGA